MIGIIMIKIMEFGYPVQIDCVYSTLTSYNVYSNNFKPMFPNKSYLDIVWYNGNETLNENYT